jgi:putative tryptophan/tyrosine transport system substrate-binding protein
MVVLSSPGARDMRRREFLGFVGCAAVTWPVVARAQQAFPVIGYLSGRTLADSKHLVAAFGKGLQEAGFVEGQNVSIEISMGGRPVH